MPAAGHTPDPPTSPGGVSGERNAALVHALFENAVDSIIIINDRGIMESVNPAVQRLFGYAPEELLGKNVAMLMPSPDRERHDSYLGRYHRTHERRIIGIGREVVAQHKDGHTFPVHLSISEMRIAGETKYAGILHDMTERKVYEDALRQRAHELREAKEAAENANQAKDQFLAVLSHELRTPLTPALAMLSVLERDTALDPEGRDAISVIRRNVELEARLIDDLLDLTRVARGKLQLHLQSIDAHAAIRDTLEICKPEVAARSLDVKVDLRATQPFVLADPARFRQVLWNLLKNAIKFTPPGGRITLTTRNHACDLTHPPLAHDLHVDGQCLEIEVRDSGIGIEPHALTRIFDAFEQGGAGITRQFGGLGLGLAISRALADMHHGRLTAHSDGKGKGALFRFELHSVQPATAQPEAEPQPGSPRSRGLSILLVDDHPDTVRAMQILLRRLGHHPATAQSVAEAKAKLTAGRYDLLVSDIGLPDGSGLELMEVARTHGTPAGIALSGFGMDDDIRRSKAAGFVEHLTKPVDLPSLRDSVDRVAEIVAQQPPR